MTSESRGRWPDFFVIGAMKAGTTTLWRHLAAHSHVFMSEPKEPQYFSREAARARGEAWYRGLFASARPNQLCGEASACYARWPEFAGVPERIAAQLPRAKLVFVARHPVERAYSHFAHEMEERAMRGSGPQISFEEALKAVPNIVDTSRYDAQLERYLAVFPRDALHVLCVDDFSREGAGAWRDVQTFLGVPEEPLVRDHAQADNRAGDRLARVETRKLVKRLRHASGLSTLIEFVPEAQRRRIGAWVRGDAIARVLMRRRVAAQRAQLAPLEPALRAELCREFEPTTRWIEQWLGRSLAEWRE